MLLLLLLFSAYESEDTLSDGGDFLDDDSKRLTLADRRTSRSGSIPIVPAVPVRSSTP